MVRDKKKRSAGVSFHESVVDNAASSSSSSRSKRTKSAPTELEQEETELEQEAPELELKRSAAPAAWLGAASQRLSYRRTVTSSSA